MRAEIAPSARGGYIAHSFGQSVAHKDIIQADVSGILHLQGIVDHCIRSTHRYIWLLDHGDILLHCINISRRCRDLTFISQIVHCTAHTVGKFAVFASSEFGSDLDLKALSRMQDGAERLAEVPQ